MRWPDRIPADEMDTFPVPEFQGLEKYGNNTG